MAQIIMRPGKTATEFYAKKDQVRILASDVRIWFKQAGTERLTVPSVEACSDVADRINQILSLGKPIAYPTSRLTTQKYFKLGLYHVRKDRKTIATAGCSDKMRFEASDEAMQAFDDAIAEAARVLQPFLQSGRHP